MECVENYKEIILNGLDVEYEYFGDIIDKEFEVIKTCILTTNNVPVYTSCLSINEFSYKDFHKLNKALKYLFHLMYNSSIDLKEDLNIIWKGYKMYPISYNYKKGYEINVEFEVQSYIERKDNRMNYNEAFAKLKEKYPTGGFSLQFKSIQNDYYTTDGSGIRTSTDDSVRIEISAWIGKYNMWTPVFPTFEQLLDFEFPKEPSNANGITDETGSIVYKRLIEKYLERVSIETNVFTSPPKTSFTVLFNTEVFGRLELLKLRASLDEMKKLDPIMIDWMGRKLEVNSFAGNIRCDEIFVNFKFFGDK